MGHFYADDQLHGHPKARLVGTDAMGLWVLSGSWARCYNTGGHVAQHYVASWPRGKALAAKLVAAGMWEAGDHPLHGAGWWFHDWADHQPTEEQEARRRQFARERSRRFRERQSKKRYEDGDLA